MNTAAMAQALAKDLREAGAKVDLFNTTCSFTRTVAEEGS